MSEITIPDEAVEAMLSAYGCNCTSCRKAVLHVAKALLKAWPNGEKVYRSEDEMLFTIILPLPQEKTDAEA